jgi:hypothetical protein
MGRRSENWRRLDRSRALLPKGERQREYVGRTVQQSLVFSVIGFIFVNLK